MTVAAALEVSPEALVAVRRYVVVEAELTVIEAIRELVQKSPGAIATETAFETFHERTEVPRGATVEGVAEKALTTGIVDGVADRKAIMPRS